MGEQGGAVEPGGGTIFTEPVLVVTQKTKFIEVNNEYAIHDQQGQQIGSVRQVGQSKAKKVLRFLGTPVDKHLTFKLQIVDLEGNALLELVRPAKLMKSRVIVHDATGNEVGQIVQQNALGKIRFSMESGGDQLGSINGENWTSFKFSIQDHAGEEIARITRSLDGLSILDSFSGLLSDTYSTADVYAVKIERPLDDPLRSLVVAAALGLDVALSQD